MTPNILELELEPLVHGPSVCTPWLRSVTYAAELSVLRPKMSSQAKPGVRSLTTGTLSRVQQLPGRRSALSKRTSTFQLQERPAPSRQTGIAMTGWNLDAWRR